MSKDRVKFSDATRLYHSIEDAEADTHSAYKLYIPKEKFEDRSFICDLVGHQARYIHNRTYKCIYCNTEADNHFYFPAQNKKICEFSGHTFPDPNTNDCWRCGDLIETPEPQEQPENQKTIDQINAMIRNVEDNLVDMKALVAGMMGE